MFCRAKVFYVEFYKRSKDFIRSSEALSSPFYDGKKKRWENKKIKCKMEMLSAATSLSLPSLSLSLSAESVKF